MRWIHAYESPLGKLLLSSDGKAVTGLWFEGQKHFGAGLAENPEEKDLPVFRLADRWLDKYFSGKKPDTVPPLRLSGTAFSRAVWEELLLIPYGQTVTYGEIAGRMAGRLSAQFTSPRAVGAAVGRNPVSLMVPCHRVVGADGRLTGYAGGVERKRLLLEREGVTAGGKDR
jgi:methylated-DNA-[protein]-cysteine S-methyltransferase